MTGPCGTAGGAAPDRLRPARARDAPLLADCVAQAYAHYIERIGKPPGPMLDDYAAVIRDHDVHVLAREGRIAGAVVLMTREGRVLLDNIAVRPEDQGTRLGRQLMDFAEARARQQEHCELHLYTHALMHENIAWYGRRGYTVSARVNEAGFDRVYMRKLLHAR